MPEKSRIYFASDFHLGVPGYEQSRERERRLVRWLDLIKADAAELYLMGDVFDFWFEYRYTVPKGYLRFLGKLAELSDSGVKITFFRGNHDMWMFDYFKKELNATIISNELELERNGKLFFLHHGDGLGPGDTKYKFLKKFFRSGFCQWLFTRLHPNLSFGIATRWSKNSRLANGGGKSFDAREEKWLKECSDEILARKRYDYLVFGHRHLPMDIALSGGTRYVNLGEWVNFNTYAVFDGEKLELKSASDL
jgi:UDP-2,3-diacylglucosamine hydrolase